MQFQALKGLELGPHFYRIDRRVGDFRSESFRFWPSRGPIRLRGPSWSQKADKTGFLIKGQTGRQIRASAAAQIYGFGPAIYNTPLQLVDPGNLLYKFLSFPPSAKNYFYRLVGCRFFMFSANTPAVTGYVKNPSDFHEFQTLTKIRAFRKFRKFANFALFSVNRDARFRQPQPLVAVRENTRFYTIFQRGEIPRPDFR